MVAGAFKHVGQQDFTGGAVTSALRVLKRGAGSSVEAPRSSLLELARCLSVPGFFMRAAKEPGRGGNPVSQQAKGAVVFNGGFVPRTNP